jgi:hypothetical protein
MPRQLISVLPSFDGEHASIAARLRKLLGTLCDDDTAALAPHRASEEGVRASTRPRVRRVAAAAPVFVLVVWLVLVIAACRFVAAYASPIPFMDDMTVATWLDPHEPIWSATLWRLNNEHRVPLADLANATLVRLTSDMRGGMYLEVAILGLVSLAMIFTARKLRGRTSYADAFFPLLWLHWGNAEDWLMAFQLSLMFPIALVATALMTIATRARHLTRSPVAVIGASVFLLPLNGGHGLTQAPALMAWLAIVGYGLWRAPDPDARRAGRWMIAFTLATTALIGIYFIGYESTPSTTHPRNLTALLRGTLNFTSLAIGPATQRLWPYSVALVTVVCAITTVLLVRAWRARPDERIRASGLLACIGCVATMALSVGWGRNDPQPLTGIALRYVSLPSSLLCAAYFAWELYAAPRTARVVQYALCALMAALFVSNSQYGVEYGEQRRQADEEIRSDVAAGLSIPALADRHWERLSNSAHNCEMSLYLLEAAHAAPFEHHRAAHAGEPDASSPYPMFRTMPARALSPAPVIAARQYDENVLMVRPTGELRFALPHAAHALRIGFGIHRQAYQDEKDAAVRFAAEIATGDDAGVVIFERTLEPGRRALDRGVQRAMLALPPRSEAASAELVLRTLDVPGHDARWSWSFWTDVEIE